MGKPEVKSSVSVIIPTWNAAAFVAKVLEKLALQRDVDFEVLVVDNGVVNQETEVVTRSFEPRIRSLRYLRFEKQLGYAGAVNAGTKEAKHSLVAVMNNDNLPEPDWLSELVRAYEMARQEGKEAIVSSLVHRPDFPNPLAAVSNIWGRIVRPEGVKQDPYVPFHPDGSAFLFSKEAFGLPYDEDYFIYHEDVYLGWRAWLEGKEVRMATASRVETFDGGSTRRIAYRTAYYTERNRWLNYLLFLEWNSFFRLLPIFLLDYVVKLIAGGNQKAKIHAAFWICTHLPLALEKRREIQSRRVKSDREILSHVSGTYASEGQSGQLLSPIFRVYQKVMGLSLGD